MINLSKEDQMKLINNIRSGDNNSLEFVLTNIQDIIYNISIKMLFSKEDAEDATQEILLKIIKNLYKYKGESKFTTWIYVITKNYLLTARKKRAESQTISFDIMAESLGKEVTSLLDNDIYSVEKDIIIADLKIGCTQAMLLCLDRDKRLLFILSKMFGITSIEGAKIFNISPSTYRKRLSRINKQMKNFLSHNCGLINESATCKCEKRLSYAIKHKRINAKNPYFVPENINKEEINSIILTMENLDEESDIFRTNPMYAFKQEKLNEIIEKISQNIN